MTVYHREGTGVFRWLPDEQISQLVMYCKTEQEAQTQTAKLNRGEPV